MLLVNLLLLYLFCPFFSFGQTEIYVRGGGKLYPIAVPRLCTLTSQSADLAKKITEVLIKDLKVSGYFEVLNPNMYLETQECKDENRFAYSDWSVIGADGLIKGSIKTAGSQIVVRLFLHDVALRKVVLGKEYRATALKYPEIAHRFANAVMKFFTGESGVFGTKIVFSGRVGRFKELFLMDMDGSNLEQLTEEKGLALSPSWHPSGEKIVYTSYRRRVPDLFEYNLRDHSVRQITNTPELEIGAKYSKDGKYILASRAVGAYSSIVLYSLQGQLLSRITSSWSAIDVSADWSPDNSKIVFASNRSGGPQIYIANGDGTNIKRVSFADSNYCTSPAWSPKGDKIAFVCRIGGLQQIFISKPDGSDLTQLTSRGNNEDPSWSPNGKYLVFSTSALGRYHIAVMRISTQNINIVTGGRAEQYDPAWSPLPITYKE
ncbi:MAG: hypothetical protein D6780_05100 [Candidatus Dadabacteria bacterium]|nr:MAG: hypothetical protein D6780_05100 [Candidatus Dadabacteria bacterium]